MIKKTVKKKRIRSRSLYPLNLEKELSFIYKFNSKKLLDKYTSLISKNNDQEMLPLIEFSKEEKIKIIQDLSGIAIKMNSQVFNSWRTLSDDELKQSDLKGAKIWIKENYNRINSMADIFSDQMQEFKEKQYHELLKSFNSSLNHRFDKLLEGRISNTDVNKLLTELKGFYAPNNEIKTLIERLEKTRTLNLEDANKLKDWANNRNELWARNETGNLYATKLEEMWEENDIDEFIWRTMKDSKVRMEHQEREGKTFKISEGILPGQDYGCRCWAEPKRKKRGGEHGNRE